MNDMLKAKVLSQIARNMRPDIFDKIYRSILTTEEDDFIAMIKGQIVLKFKELNSDELASLSSFMDRCNCNDDFPEFRFNFDGREWLIGDGDDRLATSFVNGGLRIWVRSWD